MRDRRSALLLFAKAPVPGNAKTRLIPVLGDVMAAELHAAMVTHCVAMASRCGLKEVQLWCAPDINHPLFSQLRSAYNVTLHKQTAGDLGKRMRHAFQVALNQHDAVVVMGTDCPKLNPEVVYQAFNELYVGRDAVIAPAEDGGYVLLGLRKADAKVFSAIDWGTDRVYRQTEDRFNRMRWSWRALDTQWDVDRPEDLQRLIRHTHQSWHPQLQEIVEKINRLNPHFPQ